jgi:hypothetical protein
MDLVVPRLTGEPRAGQQHVITAEHSRGHYRRARHHDQPRPGRSGRRHPANGGAEPDRAGTQHHKRGYHDLRIPGILRGQAAQLHPCRRVTGLAQRADHPGRGEQQRARDASPSGQPAEFHHPARLSSRCGTTSPGPPRVRVAACPRHDEDKSSPPRPDRDQQFYPASPSVIT